MDVIKTLNCSIPLSITVSALADRHFNRATDGAGSTQQ